MYEAGAEAHWRPNLATKITTLNNSPELLSLLSLLLSQADLFFFHRPLLWSNTQVFVSYSVNDYKFVQVILVSLVAFSTYESK